MRVVEKAAVLMPLETNFQYSQAAAIQASAVLSSRRLCAAQLDCVPLCLGFASSTVRVRSLVSMFWTQAGSGLMGGGMSASSDASSGGSGNKSNSGCERSNSVRRSQRRIVLNAFRDFLSLHGDDIPYVRQSYSWDCGLACVEMALRARGIAVSNGELRGVCDTDSVWSIDISYLLRRYSVDFTYYTITAGVREEYQQQEFYRKQLAQDRKRVIMLFARARGNGVKVVEHEVEISDIAHAISVCNKIVIVLVDKRLMRCRLCCAHPSSQSMDAHPGSRGARYSSNFLGHYVVLYAYDAKNRIFLMKDPAASRRTCAISSEALEEARKAFGTDQDIIYIGDVLPESEHSHITESTCTEPL